MRDASSLIQEQYRNGGVIPGQLVGQDAVSKDYVDGRIGQVEQKADKAQSDIANHVNSTEAHISQNITYSGSVPEARNVKQGLDNLNGRVDRIVSQAGDDNTEIVDARGAYQVLSDRLDASDARLVEWAINVKHPPAGFSAAAGDGQTDDTESLQAILTYVATNGGTMYLPPGTYNISNILSHTTGSGKPFSIIGAGLGKSIVQRVTDYAGTLINIGYLDNVMIEGITINANHGLYPSGNHGISLFDGSNLRVRRVEVIDYKNSGIIIYATTPINTFKNCIIEDCIVDGKNASNNGILIADISYSGIRNCHVYNVGKTGSPCYGLQLKNGCDRGFVTGCYVDNAILGIAIGNYGTGDNARGIVSNNRIFNCNTGIGMGDTKNYLIEGNIIDMNNNGLYAIDFQTDSTGNAVKGLIVLNMLSSRACIRFRAGDTDNSVELDVVSNSSGTQNVVAEFLSGSLRNYVSLNNFSNPTTVSNSESLVNDLSTGSTNIFDYRKLPNKQNASITADTITLKHAKIMRVKVDTEGGAATDNLATITGGVDGQIITIQQVANARDVTIKHATGNIRLSSASDFSFTTINQTLTLIYDAAAAAWLETGRGTAT